MRAPPSWTCQLGLLRCRFQSVRRTVLPCWWAGLPTRGQRGWVVPVSAVCEDCQAYEAGRPWALSASRAARTVRPGRGRRQRRPVLPSMPMVGMMLSPAVSGRWCRRFALVVAVGGDVQGADSCFCVEVRLDGLDAGCGVVRQGGGTPQERISW